MTATGVTISEINKTDLEMMNLMSAWKQNDNADLIVKSGSGILRGILCTAASGTPTLTIYDGTDANGTVMVKQFTPVAGTYYNFWNAYFSTGLFLDVGGTTVELTTIFR